MLRGLFPPFPNDAAGASLIFSESSLLGIRGGFDAQAARVRRHDAARREDFDVAAAADKRSAAVVQTDDIRSTARRDDNQ